MLQRLSGCTSDPYYAFDLLFLAEALANAPTNIEEHEVSWAADRQAEICKGSTTATNRGSF